MMAFRRGGGALVWNGWRFAGSICGCLDKLTGGNIYSNGYWELHYNLSCSTWSTFDGGYDQQEGFYTQGAK
jgi:hypothetical protein